jgi:hypothetical protein
MLTRRDRHADLDRVHRQVGCSMVLAYQGAAADTLDLLEPC